MLIVRMSLKYVYYCHQYQILKRILTTLVESCTIFDAILKFLFDILAFLNVPGNVCF